MIKTRKLLSLLLVVTMIFSFATMTIVNSEEELDDVIAQETTSEEVGIQATSNEFVGIIPALGSGWAANQGDITMLANYMDEPLYTAIVNKYAVGGAVGTDPTVDQAKAWVGSIILGAPTIKLTGGIRGIENFEKITILDLNTNALTGELPANIGNAGSAGTGLTSVRIQANQLSGELPASLGNFTKLTVFDLAANKLTGSIPSELSNVGKDGAGLQWFQLHTNQLSGSIPAELGSLNFSTGTTAVLALHTNQFSDSIPASFANLVNVKNLYLHNNKLSGQIPDLSALAPNLININVSNNQLIGPVPDFSAFTKLTTCVLGGNNFDEPQGVNRAFTAESKNLEGWILAAHSAIDTNRDGVISVDEAKAYTGSISVSNRNPKITGTMAGIENFERITSLELHTNALTGELPANIGNVGSAGTGFTGIRIQSNQLSGELPASLGNFKKVTTFDLSNNKFTGSIPSELGNVGKDGAGLQWFYLQTNQLSGSIPAELGNLKFSTGVNSSFYLHTNQLSGPIPAELGNLTSVTSFNFSGNCLTGSIPVELANVGKDGTGLTIFNLSYNFLTGSIPSEVGNLNFASTGTTRTLDLSYNRLTGSIPDSFGNLTNLLSLSLGFNQLGGTIPASFVPTATTGMKALTSLSITDNNIAGGLDVIPQILTLVSINISTNKLSGTIPDLRPLTSLQSITMVGLPGLTGGLPEVGSALRTLNVRACPNLSGTIPVSYESIPFANLSIVSTQITGTDKPANTLAENFFADWYGLNTVSTIAKYSDPTTKYGAQNGGYMVLNQDIHGTGKQILNIVIGGSVPNYNIDVNGDGKADINVCPTGVFIAFDHFNQGSTLYKTNSSPAQLMGWRSNDMKVVAGAVIDETTVRTSTTYPYYLENVDPLNPVLVPNTKTIIGTDGLPHEVYPPNVFPINPLELNGVGTDGKPTNVDLNGDGIPDLNIVGTFPQIGEQIVGAPDPITGLPSITATNPTVTTDPDHIAKILDDAIKTGDTETIEKYLEATIGGEGSDWDDLTEAEKEEIVQKIVDGNGGNDITAGDLPSIIGNGEDEAEIVAGEKVVVKDAILNKPLTKADVLTLLNDPAKGAEYRAQLGIDETVWAKMTSAEKDAFATGIAAASPFAKLSDAFSAAKDEIEKVKQGLESLETGRVKGKINFAAGKEAAFIFKFTDGASEYKVAVIVESGKEFTLENVPEGTYTLETILSGYTKATFTNVEVKKGETTVLKATPILNPGDLNGDGVVNGLDYSLLIGAFGMGSQSLIN